MSIRLLLAIFTLSTMLKNGIHYLKEFEPASSRRGLLIKILKNSEKQAKNDEKIQFLTSCRRADITPKFIQNCLSASLYALGNDRICSILMI